MKALHRPDLYCWSTFNPDRNIDFHSYAWIRPEGNVLIDPLPLCDHDLKHLQSLGGAAWIVITNSDHIRDAQSIAHQTGAQIAGPVGEQETFPIECDRWLSDGEEWVVGLQILEMQGSKTPGELALFLDGRTLITGDLVRAHCAGSLMILPEAKLQDRSAAVASIQRLANLGTIDAVLVGDGWPIFEGGQRYLQNLVAELI